MADLRFAELVPVLQVAVGPVILISGVGLLLLTMTNRFGRIIDRSRILAAQLHHGAPDEKRRAETHLEPRPLHRQFRQKFDQPPGQGAGGPPASGR